MKKVLTAVVLLLALVLSACGSGAESDNNTVTGEYVSGYWTDGKTNYIYLRRSADNMFFTLNTNLITTADDAVIYVLQDGVLYGASDASADKTQVFTFEYSDENTLNVINSLDGSESTFIRDSFEYDGSRLDDEYVFWTFDRAAVFLQGSWTDRNSSYFSLYPENNKVRWSSDLMFPEYDTIDFCDGNLCSVKLNENGSKTMIPAYEIHIEDKDHVLLKSLTEDYESEFRREAESIDEIEDLNEYVFFNSASTVSFLEGSWTVEDGKQFFILQLTDGQFGLNTNLSMPDYDGYNFSGNTIYGVNEGKEEPIFEIKINSIDEIEIFCFADEQTFVLCR